MCMLHGVTNSALQKISVVRNIFLNYIDIFENGDIANEAIPYEEGQDDHIDDCIALTRLRSIAKYWACLVDGPQRFDLPPDNEKVIDPSLFGLQILKRQ